MPVSSRRGSDDRYSRHCQVTIERQEALWLVFARPRDGYDLSRFGMSRARSRLWYRRCGLEDEARGVAADVRLMGLTVWVKYEADLPIRSPRLVERSRKREFEAYKTTFRAEPAAVAVALPPDRDRSSGRRSYAEHRYVGTQAESRDK